MTVDNTEAGSSLSKYQLMNLLMASHTEEVEEIDAIVEWAKKQAKIELSSVKHPILEKVLVLKEFYYRNDIDCSSYSLYWIHVRVSAFCLNSGCQSSKEIISGRTQAKSMAWIYIWY